MKGNGEGECNLVQISIIKHSWASSSYIPGNEHYIRKAEMPDAQSPSASPNLWQTTLTENTAPPQRRPTHIGATSDQTTKEKQTRTMRQMGAQAPPSHNVGNISDVEVECS